MKYFVMWAFALIFSPVWGQVDDTQQLTNHALSRVNQFKINNQNDSALYELITLNSTLKSMGRESGYLYIDMGNIYFQLRLYTMARKFYGKALTLFTASGDIVGESIVLENLGNIHNRVNPESDSAFHYFQQALSLQKKAHDPIYAAHSQSALALYYSRHGEPEQAQAMIRAAIDAVQSPTVDQHPRYAWDVQFIPQQVYLTASDIYRYEQRQPDSAEYFLKQAIRMTQLHGIDAHRVRYTTFLGTFYLDQQQYDKALPTIEYAIQLSDSIGYVWGKVSALQALRNYYHQIKDSKKEIEAGYEYLSYKDKMYNERNNDDLIVMSNLILQYENELEIERQQNLITEKERINALQQRQNYMLMGILIVLSIALAGIVVLYRSLKTKNKLVQQYLQELEVSNETMRTMLSVISHDVRSPFNSLLGLSRITLMEDTLQPHEYRERVSMMHDTSAKGLILLDNLLQWVALQRDKTLIKKESIDIPKLVNETLHELSSVALTQNVTIEQRIEAATHETDRNALKVIVRNLLTNAIKYSAGKKVLLDIEATSSSMHIRVTDQGPGIPEEIRENLFGEGDMKKVAAKGGGLGMQIVKQLVTDLNGTIQATNLPEGGARFEVYLP